jgi:hypothetical protein
VVLPLVPPVDPVCLVGWLDGKQLARSPNFQFWKEVRERSEGRGGSVEEDDEEGEQATAIL